MLAFAIRNKKLVATKQPLPKLRPGWALVRVRLAGICNTDIELLRGYHAFRGTPGHEFVGEIAEVRGVSSRERDRWIGRRVAGEAQRNPRIGWKLIDGGLPPAFAGVHPFYD